MAQKSMPTYKDLLWPTLKALESTGGSASNEELSVVVAGRMDLPDEILEAAHKEGGAQTEVDYRAAWARTYLKMIGAVENSERGVWAIADKGRRIPSEAEVRQIVKDALKERRKAWKLKNEKPGDSDEEIDDGVSWEEDLLSILRQLTPPVFERLCQRILRESGFTKVEVTGRSGDGGIDGAGVLRVNLLSLSRAVSVQTVFGIRRSRRDQGFPQRHGGGRRQGVVHDHWAFHLESRERGGQSWGAGDRSHRWR